MLMIIVVTCVTSGKDYMSGLQMPSSHASESLLSTERKGLNDIIRKSQSDRVLTGSTGCPRQSMRGHSPNPRCTYLRC